MLLHQHPQEKTDGVVESKQVLNMDGKGLNSVPESLAARGDYVKLVYIIIS